VALVRTDVSEEPGASFIVFFLLALGGGELNGCVRRNILKLPLGGLHVKHTEQQSSVEFGYQLSICSGTKETNGKP
jgi:hypothetical protein